MKRRKFLTLAGIGSAIAAVASLKFFTTSFESSAAGTIKEALDFLNLDPEGIDKFVKAYSKNKDPYYKLTMKSYGLLGIGASKSGKVHQMVSTYLLSTDFFTNKMDESGIVRFVGLYDPYARPCSHPFNHVQYPSS